MSEDPTYVLVPGMASTAAMWLPVVQELALRGLGSFPVELPGHGFDAQFPDGYQCPQDDAQLLSARSPIASLSLDDYADHVLAIVRRVVAEQRRVILVGHSLGGNVVTRVANAVPELLSALVYVCAYCCVESPNVLAYAPRNPDPYSPLARARQLVWIGDPRQTGCLAHQPAQQRRRRPRRPARAHDGRHRPRTGPRCSELRPSTGRVVTSRRLAQTRRPVS